MKTNARKIITAVFLALLAADALYVPWELTIQHPSRALVSTQTHHDAFLWDAPPSGPIGHVQVGWDRLILRTVALVAVYGIVIALLSFFRRVPQNKLDKWKANDSK